MIGNRTGKRYDDAVAKILAWLDWLGLAIPADPLDVDDVVAEYVEACWQEGDVRSTVGDALSGLGHMLLALRGHLKYSWRLFTAWARTEMPDRATPMSLQVLYGVAGAAVGCDAPAGFVMGLASGLAGR